MIGDLWEAYAAGDPLARAVATFHAAAELGFSSTDWLDLGPADNYLGQTE
ncbi:hypothetical protein NLX62_03410 [Mycobacteriaceae bacterium Msp059]|nr:hypothetical protein [Mycobacteriaceae bacterium Msp059]